jgi:hypothetical protein
MSFACRFAMYLDLDRCSLRVRAAGAYIKSWLPSAVCQQNIVAA